MSEDGALLARLQAALHPLDAPPADAPWNLAGLADLLPGTEPVAAAVLLGLVPRAAGLQVLLTLRTDGLRHHAGQVSFPGGRIEPEDADACAAAIREAGEEVGLAPVQIAPLGYLDPLATITGFRVLPVVATLDPGYVPAPDPREVAEVFEAPLARLLEPAALVYNRIDWAGRPREVAEFVASVSPGRRIWGATASILDNLRQRLERTT
ncbi:MAG TPA: CoA pyrophosphatase [Xanthomonadaceae bacterium]|nr:CoA pyrophosphatase [Xanthomonadaceae bacterium]